MGYFDSIVRNHAMFNSRKFGIPSNVCKLHGKSHDKIQFRNKIKYNVTNIACCIESNMLLVTVPTMEIIKQVAPVCIVQLPNDHKT